MLSNGRNWPAYNQLYNVIFLAYEIYFTLMYRLKINTQNRIRHVTNWITNQDVVVLPATDVVKSMVTITTVQ